MTDTLPAFRLRSQALRDRRDARAPRLRRNACVSPWLSTACPPGMERADLPRR